MTELRTWLTTPAISRRQSSAATLRKVSSDPALLRPSGKCQVTPLKINIGSDTAFENLAEKRSVQLKIV